jgi:hypothetical protein
MTRSSALLCSIRAFCLSEFFFAFWYGLVRGDFRRDFLGHQFSHAIIVGPRDIAELIVERFEDG